MAVDKHKNRFRSGLKNQIRPFKHLNLMLMSSHWIRHLFGLVRIEFCIDIQNILLRCSIGFSKSILELARAYECAISVLIILRFQLLFIPLFYVVCNTACTMSHIWPFMSWLWDFQEDSNFRRFVKRVTVKALPQVDSWGL